MEKTDVKYIEFFAVALKIMLFILAEKINRFILIVVLRFVKNI